MSESLVIDFAWQRFSGKQIKAAGYQGVLRYLSHDVSKNLSRAERDDLAGEGLSICLVWETTATRASEGFSAGTDDARAANAQADYLAYPKSCALYYAVDFDASVDQVRQYFRGVQSVGQRPTGIYAGLAVMEGIRNEGIVRYGWQTVAWSGGKVSEIAHLYQRLKPTGHLPGDYDEDLVLIDNYGQWRTQQMTEEQAKQLEYLYQVFSKNGTLPAQEVGTFIHDITEMRDDIRFITEWAKAHK